MSQIKSVRLILTTKDGPVEFTGSSFDRAETKLRHYWMLAEGGLSPDQRNAIGSLFKAMRSCTQMGGVGLDGKTFRLELRLRFR